jgi:hypothetical protein
MIASIDALAKREAKRLRPRREGALKMVMM